MQFRELSDDELGRRLRDHRSSAVEAEVYRRYKPLVEAHARLMCQQLFHRGAACRGHGGVLGACDGVYEVAFSEIMRRVLGTDGRRPLCSILVSWATARRHASQTFGRFLAMALHVDDVLRAWCADRKLPTRGDRPPVGLVTDLTRAYRDAWVSLSNVNDLAHLAPGEPGIIERWLEGLWRDAVQTGDRHLIDHLRLARWMLQEHDPSSALVAQVAAMAGRIDDFIARAWPDWYDKYLDRGRQQTNPLLPIDTAAANDDGSVGDLGDDDVAA